MKIFIRPNFLRKQSIQGTRGIVKALVDCGLTPLLSIEDYQKLQQLGMNLASYEIITGSAPELLKACDVILPVGGDGTVLHEALFALEENKAVLGINAGRLGFLSQLELSELSYLSRLDTGEYTISERMLLEVEINQKNNDLQTFTAINDVVVSRGEINQILDVSVFDKQKERLILRQRADGIIFATPTGSTAYSYSAGGPVTSPEMDAILLTPIAPHTPFRSGLVLPSGAEYYVKEVHPHEKTGFGVSVDGTLVTTVEPNEKADIIIRKSQQSLKFIDLGLRDFYTNLNDKMMTMNDTQ